MAHDLIPSGSILSSTTIGAGWVLRSLVWDPYGEPAYIGPGELDAVGTSLARIYKQWDQAPFITAVVRAIGQGMEQVVSEQFQLSKYRYLAHAFGQTLDEIGALVGLERQGLVDETCRLAIGARGASMVGDAGIDAVMRPAKHLLGADSVQYLPQYPRSFCYLVLIGLGADDVDLLVRLLRDVVAGAGIGAKILLAPPESPGWDWSTPQAWAASWSSAYGAVDASVVAPWSWSVSL